MAISNSIRREAKRRANLKTDEVVNYLLKEFKAYPPCGCDCEYCKLQAVYTYGNRVLSHKFSKIESIHFKHAGYTRKHTRSRTALGELQEEAWALEDNLGRLEKRRDKLNIPNEHIKGAKDYFGKMGFFNLRTLVSEFENDASLKLGFRVVEDCLENV
jgi:hypothetical protein